MYTPITKMVCVCVYMRTHIYEGESKSNGKKHLTALIEVTVSNFRYHFFLHNPLATQCIFYIVQLVCVSLRRRSILAALDVVLCAGCWWPTRTAVMSNTCLTWSKHFHPLTNISLTNGALSILSQHMMVNFHSSVHVFALVATTQLKEERCTANGWTVQQALSILRSAPAPLCPG
jgi:hypothetical protein